MAKSESEGSADLEKEGDEDFVPEGQDEVQLKEPVVVLTPQPTTEQQEPVKKEVNLMIHLTNEAI